MSSRIAARHGDDRVGALERRPLAERRQGVAAAELFGLPGPQRLEAVGRHHVGDVVEEAGQVAGEVGVPGVGVDEVGALARRRPSAGRPTASAQRAGAAGPASSPAGWPDRSPATAACRSVPRTPKQRTSRSTSRASSAQVLDVDARAAVDLRRVLAGEEGDAHHAVTASPFGSHDHVPWAITVKRRASCLGVDADLRAAAAPRRSCR